MTPGSSAAEPAGSNSLSGTGGPLRSSTVDVDRQIELLTAGAVDVISERRAAHEARAGRAAAREARHRPDRVRHPPRLRGRAAPAAPVPGPRPRRGADPRRLHRTGRRSVGQVGDPPRLTKDEVDAHAQTYLEQVGRHPRHVARAASRSAATPSGSRAMDMEDVLRLTSQVTVARMLERDDFAKRYRDGVADLADGVPVPAAAGRRTRSRSAPTSSSAGPTSSSTSSSGRHLQEQAGQEPQIVLTTPLLVGLDGEQKMSKSLGNYVGIAEPPSEQFGKLMSIPDARDADVLPVRDRVAARADRRRSRAARPRASCIRTRPSACSAAPSSTCTTATGAGAAAEAEFDRVFKDEAGARPTCPTSPSPAPARSCSPKWLLQPELAASKREATPGDRSGSRSASTASRRRRPGLAPAGPTSTSCRWEAQVGADRHSGPHCLTPTTALGSLAPRPARRHALLGRRNDGTG